MLDLSSGRRRRRRIKGYSQGDYGLAGLRAYVGPAFARGFDAGQFPSVLDDSKPWFRYAVESAAPRRVHLAKASVLSKGKEGWIRELEIDGHDVSHHDPDWPADARGPAGYVTRFAVFEFPRNSTVIARRAELERTIRHFAEHYAKYESVDQLMNEMISQRFDPDFVYEAESFATIAFSRMMFEHLGIQYSSTIIRARRDGRVETDVPLMSLPAYSRARALAAQLRQTMPKEDFERLCLYNAESHVIMQSIERAGAKADFTKLMMFPLVVPERGVTNQTMDAALATLNNLAKQERKREKPWWKFW